jgi:hypothetical protein
VGFVEGNAILIELRVAVAPNNTLKARLTPMREGGTGGTSIASITLVPISTGLLTGG